MNSNYLVIITMEHSSPPRTLSTRCPAACVSLCVTFLSFCLSPPGLQQTHEVIVLCWRQLRQLHNRANSLQDVYKSAFHFSELLVIQDCRDCVCVCVCVWHRESVWASLNGSCVFVQPHRGQGGGLSAGARVGISGADCLRQKAQQSWGSVVFVKVIKSELRDLRHLLVFFHLLHYFFISSSTAVCSVSHSQIFAEDFKSDCVTLF